MGVNLGFDIDECVSDLTTVLTKYLNDEYNVKWTKEDFDIYNLLDLNYSVDEEFNKEMAEDLIKKANSPDVQFLSKPVEGAVKYLNLFKRSGHKLFFISSRPEKQEETTMKWFKKYKIPYNKIIHTGHEKSKGVVGRQLKLDLYVDDLEKHLESMIEYQSKHRYGLLLFNRPWNRRSMDASKFTRIYNWAEIYRKVDKK